MIMHGFKSELQDIERKKETMSKYFDRFGIEINKEFNIYDSESWWSADCGYVKSNSGGGRTICTSDTFWGVIKKLDVFIDGFRQCEFMQKEQKVRPKGKK